MKYKISEFSKISGISERNLRYFESIGLIAPERSESGYRLYSYTDSYRINTFNSLRVQGYSLSQAAARTEGMKPEQYVSELSDNIKKMELEKALLEKKIDWAKMLEAVYSNAEKYKSQPVIQHVPECKFLLCTENEDLTPSLPIGHLISEMVDILPISVYAGKVSEDDDRIALGMMAPASALEKYGIDSGDMLTIPEGDYIFILTDSFGRHRELYDYEFLKPYFPAGFPDTAYIIYLMVETLDSEGRGFLMIKL